MRFVAMLSVACWTVLLGGCTDRGDPYDIVARVGESVLTRSQFEDLWTERMVRSDSSGVATAIVDQWIVSELLYQEALRRGLQADSLVNQQIENNRRSLLIASLLEELYSEEKEYPDRSAVETWYQQHTDRLELKEPYVLIWYLPVDSAAWTSDIADQLQTAASDSIFANLVASYSALKEQSMYFASGLLPMSHVFSQHGSLRKRVEEAEEGEVVPSYREDGLIHLIKVMERAPAGTVPDIDMILPEIEQRILIESRKQLFARQVQLLRTSAQARNDLFVKE